MLMKFQHPFTAIVAGPSGCGKTTFVCKLLSNLEECITENIGKVFWCHAEENAKPSSSNQLAGDIESKLNITYHLGIPETFQNLNNEPILIILDDLMQEVDDSRISALFTRGSHHRNMSVILITQNIFHKGKHMRDISLNAKYIIVFKNPRDQSQFYHLARQLYPDRREVEP